MTQRYVPHTIGPYSAHQALQVLQYTPWRAINELRRIAALPYIWLMFRLHGIGWGQGWRIYGMPIIQRWGGSQIVIGENVSLRSWYSTNPLAPNHPVVLVVLESEW
jgi:hypothetical protein